MGKITLADRRLSDGTHLAGRHNISCGAMAVYVVLYELVSQSVIRSDGVMPPGVHQVCHQVSYCMQREQWCLRPLLKTGRVGVDERFFGNELHNDAYHEMSAAR